MQKYKPGISSSGGYPSIGHWAHERARLGDLLNLRAPVAFSLL